MLTLKILHVFAFELKDSRRPSDEELMDSQTKQPSDQLGGPVWCSECYLRIAPYDLRTVFRGKDYHRHCFKKMVHREGKVPRHNPSKDEK